MTADGAPSMRRRILELVQAYPGLHLREVARQLDTSVALVEYHVPALIEDGAIERVTDERNHRLFPRGHLLPRRTVMALRDAKRLQVVLRLLNGPASHADLAQQTGMGKSTLSFHLRRLEKADIVAKDGNLYRVRAPERLRTLVQENRPTPDLLSRFADLWNDLYDA